jgi:hypothetical protein
MFYRAIFLKVSIGFATAFFHSMQYFQYLQLLFYSKSICSLIIGLLAMLYAAIFQAVNSVIVTAATLYAALSSVLALLSRPCSMQLYS